MCLQRTSKRCFAKFLSTPTKRSYKISCGERTHPSLYNVSNCVIKEIGERNKLSCPLAAQALLRQTYIDDILAGADTFDDLNLLYSELIPLLNSHGFQLHKFCSNSKEFLTSISAESLIDLDLSFEGTSTKVLGLKWRPGLDCLTISVPENSFQGPVTKTKDSLFHRPVL